MNSNSFRIAVSALSLLLSLGFINAQYRCDWNTFSGGSGKISSSNYQCQATVIQSAIGNIVSNNMRGFIGFWLPVTPTALLEPKTEEIFNPQQLVTRLYNATPNLFRNLTTIHYSLANETKVLLNIYDISGRLVKTLVDRKQEPGFYNVHWNAKNNRNQSVSEGVYFYQLQTANYTATKKLIIIQ